MIRNPIFQSMAVVLVLWYLVFDLLAPNTSFANLFPDLVRSGYVAGLGVLAGCVLGLFGIIWHRSEIAYSLRPTAWNGITITLGAFPSGRPTPIRRPGHELFATFQPWFDTYAGRNPVHGRLMNAIAEIFNAHPSFPASHIPGGHGGVTLATHSLNVLRSAIALAPTFSYSGHRNRHGQVVFHLLDHEFEFNPDDPMVPLVAFAHDVGKLTAFSPIPRGGAKVLRPHHDTEGGHVLRSIPECWELPMDDREALLLAVSYRHHCAELPGWAPDRARALLEFVVEADIAASHQEGDRDAATTRSFMAAQANAQAAGDVPESLFAKLAGDSGVVGDVQQTQADVSQGREPLLSVPQAGSVSQPGADELDWVFRAVVDILAEPERINGNKKNLRIGFKYGDWLYINEPLLRTALSERMEIPTIATPPGKFQVHPVTHALLAKLIQLGRLRTDWQGSTLTANRAMFRTIVHGHGGKVVNQILFTIIARATLLPHLASMPDCKFPPVIERPSWGDAPLTPGGEISEIEAVAPAVLPSLDDDALAKLRQAALQLADGVPFRARRNAAGVACFYFPEAYVLSTYTCKYLPPKATWVTGESGDRYLCLFQEKDD